MLAIITGATKGIGRAVSIRLASEGIDIVAISSSKNNLEELKKFIEKTTKAKCYIHVCDLTNKNQRLHLISSLAVYEQKVSILVNNFGRYSVGTIEEISSTDLITNFEHNVVTAFELSQFIAPIFKEKKEGYIFNILSVLAEKTRQTAAAYTISKHAMNGLNKLLADELREFEVKVCGIYPGSVNTSSWDGIAVDRSKMIQPEDIATLISQSLKLSDQMFIERIDLNPLDKTT
tara:strand:+ start:2037 stop:2735 length:699 start_codon:yes stop_codon:yes gene_type:complete